MNFAWGNFVGWTRAWRRSRVSTVVAVLAVVAVVAGRSGAAPLAWVPTPEMDQLATVRLLSADALAKPPRVEGGERTGAVGRESALWRLPLAFEPADDRAPADAGFVARGQGYLVFIGPGGALLGMRDRARQGQGVRDGRVGRFDHPESTERTGYGMVGLRLEGANSAALARVESPMGGRVHRLKGSDPTRWQVGLQPAARVVYREVYPGVDVAYYGNGRELEYDLIVAPGASVDCARLRFDGVKSVAVDGSGQLRLATGRHGELIQRRPVAYQQGPRGRVPVTASYRLNDDGTVGFTVGAHDETRALVIDPVLSYATYFGGTGFDQIWDLAVDGTGAVYVTGETESPDFGRLTIVSTNLYLTNYQGGLANVAGDAFVAKLNPDGSAFEWLTYLGGSDMDVGLTLGLAPGGEAVIGGFTTSTNFPVTAGAFQKAVSGDANRYTQRRPLEGFITRLKSDGSGLQASTLLGGTREDQVIDLAALPDGRVVAVGSTTSTNFPVTPGALRSAADGFGDAFIAVFSAGLDTLERATLLGGSARDTAEGVAVDSAAGWVHLVGITSSTNLPVTAARQATLAGGADGFAAGVRLADLTPVYVTYLGGAFDDHAYRAALGAGGALWIVGDTGSSDFPVVGALQSTNAGTMDGFIARLSGDGQTLEFSTLLGGAARDSLWDVAVDSTGTIHAVGDSWSTNVPGLSASSIQSTNAGQSDLLIAHLSAAGVLETTLYGGTGEERGNAVGIDSAGNTYVGGQVRLGLFPANTNGVVQPGFGGGEADGIVMKVARAPALAIRPGLAGVHVSWAAPNPGFRLESSVPERDGTAGTWRAESSPMRVESGQHQVWVPGAEPSRLFRLRWAK